MSLRITSVTPRSLAARRSNALKSTGPRSRRGKARVCLNALKHGRYAVLAMRSARLREKLFEAGQTGQEAVYGAIRSRIAQAMRVQDTATRRSIDEIALRAWCLARRMHLSGTKLESPLISGTNRPRVPTESRFARRRYSVVDRWTRAGMVFWCQRRRRLAGWPLGYRLYEGAVRCLLFRIAKPGALERDRYRLLANGDPDWTREPWRSLKGDGWKKWPRPKDRPWS
jgi:hypothetical protein